MCGRYSQTKGKRQVEEHFNAELHAPELLPRYNIAPTQTALVLHSSAQKTIQEMRWGFVPRWTTGGSQLLVNAKAESVAEKKTFASAFRCGRCLIVADSFFEWRGKQPVRFVLKSDEPFAFAGISETSPEGEQRFVIITTEPNDLVRTVHNRMPVILPNEKYSEWLDCDTPVNQLLDCLRPFPSELMTSYDVDPVVGSPKVDSPQCIARYQPAQGSLF